MQSFIEKELCLGELRNVEYRGKLQVRSRGSRRADRAQVPSIRASKLQSVRLSRACCLSCAFASYTGHQRSWIVKYLQALHIRWSSRQSNTHFFFDQFV